MGSGTCSSHGGIDRPHETRTLLGIGHTSPLNVPRWALTVFGVVELAAAAALVRLGQTAKSSANRVRAAAITSSGMQELTARVAQSTAGRTVTVEAPDGSTTVSPFFFTNDADRGGPTLAALMKNSKRRLGRRGRSAIEVYGTRLFEALLPEPARTNYRIALMTAVQTDSRLRILLDLDEQTTDLPWEYLFDADRASFLAMSNDTSLFRMVTDDLPTRPIEPIEQLRILVMTTSPIGLEALDVTAEMNRIEERLAPFGDLAHVRPVHGETFDDLRLALNDFNPHIFHFVGHGDWDDQADDGTVAFADARGVHHPVSGRDLGVLLNRPGLRIVLMNSCDAARTSQQDRFAGVAGSLVAQGVPAAIGMQYAIEDKAAAAFGSEFLASLVATQSIDDALTGARAAIYTVRSAVEWGTPVFTTRVPVDDIIPWG